MINPIVYRFIKKAVASDDEILAVASQYYDNDDPEDPKRRWDHVLDDIEVAKKIRGRALTPVELATLAFHDSGYKNPKGYMWGLKNHPKLSRKILKKEAPGLGFTDDEINHMAKVISYHMRTPKKGSPLLKDDLQMLMFGADEGTPKKPVDDARKYFMKAVAGRYPEVPDKDDPEFVQKLVDRVRTFKDYSDAPGLAYYHEVYPDYHRDLYNYWHSDQIIKDYEKMLKDVNKGKNIKQGGYIKDNNKFDLPDLDYDPSDLFKTLLEGVKWGVLVDNKISTDKDILINTDPKKKYYSFGDPNSKIVSCVDITNKLINNIKGTGTLATMRSDRDIPHLTPVFKHKGKYYLWGGVNRNELDEYDTLDSIGDAWYWRTTPIPAYVDFYYLPPGVTIKELDLRKVINEVKKKSKKSYRKDYTSRPLYKEASKLYTYVDTNADLSQGILSARLAPEEALLKRYKGHDYATSKEDIIKFFDENAGKNRADHIYALDAPIPDNANDWLVNFRDTHKLVSYDAEDIKDLVKILKRRTSKPPVETTADFEPRKRVQWGRDPKKVMSNPARGPFHYAPVYKLLTESGKIPPELLTIES